MSSKSRSSTAAMSASPEKKKKLPSAASFSSLPRDLALNCIARVSRLHYQTLSLVSKTLESMVASPDLYETRSRLKRTEKCLYVNLHFSFDTNPHWLTLCRLPDRNIRDERSGYFMFQVPSPNHLLPAQSSSLVGVGSEIYRIGGSDSFELQMWKRIPSSTRVSVLDCRFHTWRKAPSMTFKRGGSATSSVVDRKIYVAGGCKDKYLQSRDWIEAFDLKTQTWESLKNPLVFHLHEEHRVKAFVAKSVGLGGKLYMAGDELAVYDPNEGKWEWKEIGDWGEIMWAVTSSSHCVVDDDVMIYLVKHKGVFKWYDSKATLWKQIRGVEGGLPDMCDREFVKLVDLGGKMAVLWDEVLYTETCRENRIWCAVVGLERRRDADGDEIWGNVEWLDFVLRAHISCTGFKTVSVTV